MSLSADIKAILQADATLVAIVTGGIHDAVEIRQDLTPGAFDATTKEIKPCLLVRTGNEVSRVNKVYAVNTPLTLYFYQRSGFGSIDSALARVHTLLAGKHVAGSRVWEIRFNTEIARTTDEALYCSLAVQRYDVIRKKQ